MINLKEISKIYLEDIVALEDINLDIESNEFVFITGPSGAGKSTIIKLLVRQEKPTKGDILFEEIDVVNLPKKLLPTYRQQIGVAFQDLKLLESRTARENIEFALEIVNKSQDVTKKTAQYLLELVNLVDRADILPCQLSGGERQKIALARALANEPKLLIADEPTGNLDRCSADEIVDILKRVNSIGTTVLVVTHDLDIVNKVKEREIKIEKGKIISDDKKKAKVKKKVEKKEEVKKDIEDEEIKKEIKEEKKKEESITLLKLPKKIEKKLLENDITDLDALLDLTKSRLIKIGITEKDLEKITEAIVNVNNLKKKEK